MAKEVIKGYAIYDIEQGELYQPYIGVIEYFKKKMFCKKRCAELSFAHFEYKPVKITITIERKR